MVVLVAHSAWVSPFEMAFMRDLPMQYQVIDYVVDAFFAADIIITFFVAYFDNTTYLLVGKKSRIALRYIFFVSVSF